MAKELIEGSMEEISIGPCPNCGSEPRRQAYTPGFPPPDEWLCGTHEHGPGHVITPLCEANRDVRDLKRMVVELWKYTHGSSYDVSEDLADRVRPVLIEEVPRSNYLGLKPLSDVQQGDMVIYAARRAVSLRRVTGVTAKSIYFSSGRGFNRSTGFPSDKMCRHRILEPTITNIGLISMEEIR